MTILAFFAFLSGIVTILSPCILPVLPIVLTGSIGGKSKPLGIVAGFIFSFSLFTLALSALVQTLKIPPEALRLSAVAIIVIFGLVLTVPPLQMLFEGFISRFVGKKSFSGGNGFAGGVVTGISLSLLWTPCVGPIMASVISLAVSRQVDGGSVVIILAYSAGTALPMFAVMAGGRKLLSRFPRLNPNTAKIQRAFGIIMIIAGLAVGFGADRRFQSLVLDIFPRYGSGLTVLEQGKAVQEALDKRRSLSASEGEFAWGNPPRNTRLGDYGSAPPLVAEGPWFNTERAMSLEELRGKVVLVDFWTYSCVNCVRTLPYLREWYERYSDSGLEIIGVHSPEFPFERNRANVEKAVEDLGVTWPVVMDNDFVQWNSYNNRYWPAHFFIDARGVIRYFHFGEGSYEESESVIRKLLNEAGYAPDEAAGPAVGEPNAILTPETYLGYKRSEGFLSEIERDIPAPYSLVGNPSPGEWSLSGEWTIRNDFIEINGSGSLELGFEAKDVFLVIEPLEDHSAMQIRIDGYSGGDTADVKNGLLKPDESRLYSLAVLTETSRHTLSIKVEGHVRFFAFTFG